MRVYILRHGETDWNEAHLFQGQTDVPLNEAGRAQARHCRAFVREKRLRFDLAYSSPLRRAMETVEIVSGFPEERIRRDPRLMEVNFGPIDGTPFERDSTQCGLLFKDPAHYVPVPGAESFQEAERRLASFYLDLAAEEPAENILVGCHGAAMRLTLVWMRYIPLSGIWEQGIGNCTILEAQIPEEQIRVVRQLPRNNGHIEPDLLHCPYQVVQLHETPDRFGVMK